ncbi:hypothetical protein HDZ31DRAFT_83813 [Schizophyllum fasciatum]
MSVLLASSSRAPACRAAGRLVRRTLATSAPAPAGTSTTPEGKKVASHASLPDARMRALISLYHQSSTFITPENLDQRIDEAFAFKDLSSQISNHHYQITMRDLQRLVTREKQAPRLTSVSGMMRGPSGGNTPEHVFSENLDKRDVKMIEALYGVDRSDGRRFLPGLDAVRDEMERVEREILEDEQQQQQQQRS